MVQQLDLENPGGFANRAGQPQIAFTWLRVARRMNMHEQVQKRNGAGKGNRTLIASLEGWSFTIKLCPLFARRRNHEAVFKNLNREC